MSGNVLSLNDLLKPQQNEIINTKSIKAQDNAKTLDSFHNNHIYKLRQEGTTLTELKEDLKTTFIDMLKEIKADLKNTANQQHQQQQPPMKRLINAF